MNIVTKIDQWQKIRNQLDGKKLGFVPTMGNLHAGHMSLCRRSREENDITICSIFINPTQFNQPEDFKYYPRTLENDIELLSSYKVDYLFVPDDAAMYFDQYEIQVTETALSQVLEGTFRPGHFTGMLTVVLKLLNLVKPSRAYLGEKDYQQLLLIKKLVDALFIQTEIIGCETVRAEDGLALSSRNTRLNAEQRIHARHFPRLLHSSFSLSQIIEELTQLGFKIDYVTEMWGRRLGAVWLDDIRLIDNVVI